MPQFPSERQALLIDLLEELEVDKLWVQELFCSAQNPTQKQFPYSYTLRMTAPARAAQKLWGQ